MNEEKPKIQTSGPTPSDQYPPRAKRLPNMGNRSLVGKIPVKLLDWIILLTSLLILGTFVYFILKR